MAFLTGLPLIEVILGIAMLAVASICLVLLVSGPGSHVGKAMPFLVLFTMVHGLVPATWVPLATPVASSSFSRLRPSR